MVQSVENWSELHGTVEGVLGDPSAGRVTLRLRLERLEPVQGFPSLVAEAPGSCIPVEVPLDASGPGVATGDSVRLRVRLAGPGRYVAQPGTLRSG